ncbi:ABC transporter ATP-binding protein, partial [Fodinicola feengrottensis]|uniref:ABC transporter ATP-binding protein n=1 Tax=Fodinicola feengrottensis TaxID=435914 RepID=UPI0024426B94
MTTAVLRAEQKDDEKDHTGPAAADPVALPAICVPQMVLLVLVVVLQALAGIASPFLLREILDRALPARDLALVSLFAGGMIVASVTSGALGVATTRLSNTVGQKVMHDVRVSVYEHLQRLSLAFFTRTRTGEIQSRIANDIGGINNVITTTATSAVQSGTTAIAVAVALFVLDWRLALLALLVVPLFLLITLRVGRERRKLIRGRAHRFAAMTTLISESISVSGVLLAKTMGQRQALADRFAAESRQISDLEVQATMAGRWRGATRGMSLTIIPALVYWLAGVEFAHGAATTISLGTVVAFTSMTNRFVSPASTLQAVGANVSTSLALFGRVFEVLDLPIEIADRPSATKLAVASGDVELRDISFRYEPDAAWTLKNVSARIPAGTTTAIVGATGSGKTTLAYLVARLYEPAEGSVRIDGVDIKDVTLDSLADSVGLVAQETMLLHTSIRENLRFAQPDATDEDIERATQAAHIHDLIASLPDGYETIVGERGYRFSGGERQRIAIARVLLRNPPVLILDEATSALDNKTSEPSSKHWTSFPAAVRRSPSHTDCPQWKPRSRSWCWKPARSSNAAPTPSCRHSAAGTRSWRLANSHPDPQRLGISDRWVERDPVQDVRQHLGPAHDARSGPVEVGGSVQHPHSAVPDGGQVQPAGPVGEERQLGKRTLRRKPAWQQQNNVRLGVHHRLPVEPGWCA